MTIVIKINEDNFIIVDTCFTSFVNIYEGV